MGLCLLVYNLGQTALRQALVQADESLPNQLKKPTQRPTLRWIFQCFQAVHLLVIDGVKQITNLTDERLEILRFFSQACRDYYLLCWRLEVHWNPSTIISIKRYLDELFS